MTTPSVTVNQSVDFSLELASDPTFIDCVPHWSWHSDPSPCHKIWCILRGKGQASLREQTYELRTGALFALRPGDVIQATHDPRDPILVYRVHYLASERMVRLPRFHEVQDLNALEANARVSVHSWSRGNESSLRRCLNAVQGILMQVHDEHLNRYVRGHDIKISQLLAELEREISLKWSLDDMAKQCHMSVSTFCRAFKSMTGQSPNHYVMMKRLRRACVLLETTDMPVIQIAETLGYSDPGFFSRQFKTHLGRPPHQYRRSREKASRVER